MVPADVDLRDFAFMPLEIRRLFSSETWVLANYEERCASLCLWGESWFQVPSASLPNNDKMLAHLSQSGPRWNRVKEHAMRGWILCSDGRWYHPVVAEKALDAWAKHKKASSKGKAGAAKRWGTGNSTGTSQPMPADSNRTDMGEGLNPLSGKPDFPDDFEKAWKAYPRRLGDNPKRKALKAWSARLREGHSADELRAGVERYAEFCRTTGKVGTETVKHAATFFGPDKAFLQPWVNLPTEKKVAL